MREKGKRLIAIILSCLLLLSNVTVYAATEAEEQSDTQNTVSVNASEEVVTLQINARSRFYLSYSKSGMNRKNAPLYAHSEIWSVGKQCK